MHAHKNICRGKCYSEKTRKRKKRAYNSRIINVEHGTFTPLVFSLTGGEGPETFMSHNHIAQKIANKTEKKTKKLKHYYVSQEVVP